MDAWFVPIAEAVRHQAGFRLAILGEEAPISAPWQPHGPFPVDGQLPPDLNGAYVVPTATGVVYHGSADAPSWLERLCRIPLDFATGGRSVLELFQSAAPDLGDENRFVSLVAARLAEDPALIEAWQQYSYDKRTDQGPYMREDGEVGHLVAGSLEDVRRHRDRGQACADFIYREAVLVLEGRHHHP